MSLQNLLELQEMDREGYEVPERDTDSKRSRPKPRPRGSRPSRTTDQLEISGDTDTNPKRLHNKKQDRVRDEVQSFSSDYSEEIGKLLAVDNKAFVYDEESATDLKTGGSNKQSNLVAETKSTNKGHSSGQMFRKNYMSSDSESEAVVVARTQILTADVHHHRDNSLKDSIQEEASTWDEPETRIEIENEIKSVRSVPKARVRGAYKSRSSPNSLSNSSRSSAKIEESPQKKSGRRESEGEDYLAITMPPEKDSKEEIMEESSESRLNIKEKLMERWKKTTLGFLKSSSNSQSHDQTPAAEEPRVEKLKAKFLSRSRSKDKNKKETKDKEKKEEEALVELKTIIESDQNMRRLSKDSLFEEPVKLAKSPEKAQLAKDERRKQRQNEELRANRREPRIKKADERILTEIEQKMLLGITVHNSDLLPMMDPNVVHPVVKVTITDEKGTFIVRNRNIKGGWKESLKKQKHRYRGRDSDGEKEMSDEDITNRRTSKGEGQPKMSSNSVIPIMTQPCQVNQRMPTFAPTWNELLLFEEPFQRFLDHRSKIIIFFEIMDFLPMEGPYLVSSAKNHGSEHGWYKIAWAFLKPLGANNVENVNRKLRLQLFQPAELRSKDKIHGPEVYCWWKLNKKEKLNSTLYVTLKGIRPPQTTTASLRTILTMNKEHLIEAILDSQLTATHKSKKRRIKAKSNTAVTDIRKYPQWTRLEGQSCKVPNHVELSLPSSQVASLNLTVSGNVHCVSFSPCGLKLAAGLDTEELHVILIFEIPSGNLLRSLKGHHGLIYDLAWKILEVGDNSTEHYLASASADSTAIVWEMDSGDDSTLKEVKKLLHPTFVYCVKFHPSHPSLVATGCFDYIIRVWDIRRPIVNKRKGSPNHDSCPVFLLDRHSSYVNCLLFNNQGLQLFSGDGASCVYKWSMKSPSLRKSWKIDKDIQLNNTGHSPINSLSLHPGGNRILVHIRDSCIKILDVETFVILQSFSGLSNDKLQIRSCFSPCGNLVLSGSEDATLCIWDSDTGAILQFITPENHSNCVVTSVDYHPYDHYVVVGLSSVISEPNPILVYTYEPPKLSIAQVSNVKTTLMRHRSQAKLRAKSVETRNMKKTVSFAEQARSFMNRGDSAEKFVTIIRKLDSALLKGGANSQRSQLRIPSTASNPPSAAAEKIVKVVSKANTVTEEISRMSSDNEPGKYQRKSKLISEEEVAEHGLKEEYSSHAALVEERLQELISTEDTVGAENGKNHWVEIGQNSEVVNKNQPPTVKPRLSLVNNGSNPIAVDSVEHYTEDIETIGGTTEGNFVKEDDNVEDPDTYTLNTPGEHTYTLNSPAKNTYTLNSPENQKSDTDLNVDTVPNDTLK